MSKKQLIFPLASGPIGPLVSYQTESETPPDPNQKITCLLRIKPGSQHALETVITGGTGRYAYTNATVNWRFSDKQVGSELKSISLIDICGKINDPHGILPDFAERGSIQTEHMVWDQAGGDTKGNLKWFDNTSIILGNTSDSYNDYPHTILIWLYKQSNANFHIMSHRSSGNLGWIIIQDSGQIKFTSGSTTSHGPVGNDAYHLLAWVCNTDQDTISFYLDGSLVSTQAITYTAALPPDTQINIGNRLVTPSAFLGFMDHAQIYDSALTADQIQQTYTVLSAEGLSFQNMAQNMTLHNEQEDWQVSVDTIRDGSLIENCKSNIITLTSNYPTSQLVYNALEGLTVNVIGGTGIYENLVYAVDFAYNSGSGWKSIYTFNGPFVSDEARDISDVPTFYQVNGATWDSIEKAWRNDGTTGSTGIYHLETGRMPKQNISLFCQFKTSTSTPVAGTAQPIICHSGILYSTHHLDSNYQEALAVNTGVWQSANNIPYTSGSWNSLILTYDGSTAVGYLNSITVGNSINVTGDLSDPEAFSIIPITDVDGIKLYVRNVLAYKGIFSESQRTNLMAGNLNKMDKTHLVIGSGYQYKATVWLVKDGKFETTQLSTNILVL